MKRLHSIDILRALAIIFMVQIHFVQNLSPYEQSSAWLYDLAGALGAIPAPWFTFLVGFSLWLWLQKREGTPVKDLRRQNLRRGIFVFLVGLLFAALIWTPPQIFGWDILTLIGAASLVVFALRRWPNWALIALSALVLILSPTLRQMTGYAAHWDAAGEYTYDFTLPDVVLGFLLHGYFPLLPWIVFPLSGYLTARHFFGEQSRTSRRGLVLLGAGLIVLSLLTAALGDGVAFVIDPGMDPYSFYPASSPFIFLTLGITLIALWVLHRWLDQPDGEKPLAFFQRFSRYSLTVYIVHHAAHIWPLYLAAVWHGKSDPYWYYQNAVSTPVALALTLVFLLVLYPLLGLWDNQRGKYSFEWLLRQFSSSGSTGG